MKVLKVFSLSFTFQNLGNGILALNIISFKFGNSIENKLKSNVLIIKFIPQQ